MKFSAFLLIMLFFLFSCSAPVDEPTEKEDETSLDEEFTTFFTNSYGKLNPTNQLYVQNEKMSAAPLIYRFYEKRNFNPAWTTNLRPNRRSDSVINLLGRAKYYGLENTWYSYKKLDSLRNKLKKTFVREDKLFLATDYELLLTNSAIKFMNHLNKGVLFPDSTVYMYPHTKNDVALADTLLYALAQNNIGQVMLGMQPKMWAYRNLQSAMEQYIDSVEIDKKQLPVVPTYKEDSLLSYELASSALRYFGFIHDTISTPDSAQLMSALRKFQVRHGLNPDGKIGRHTARALKKNKHERFLQIAANLERLRWESNLPKNYAYVNIPSFELNIVDNDSVAKKHRVITGHPSTPTPLLTSAIEYIETYPRWHVPNSISANEMLPKVKSDVSYLKRNGYAVFDKNRQLIDADSVDWNKVSKQNFNFFFQQSGGYSNSLGILYFHFSNPHAVYVHDTPNKSAFGYDVRAYSHGCMRLHKPKEFAQYLIELDENKAAKDTLNSLLHSRISKRIMMETPLPIYVRYITCQTDSASNLIFYIDIYNKDEGLIKMLFKN